MHIQGKQPCHFHFNLPSSWASALKGENLPHVWRGFVAAESKQKLQNLLSFPKIKEEIEVYLFTWNEENEEYYIAHLSIPTPFHIFLNK